MTAPLVVIGTGLAGYNLVKEFRKADAERQVIMITADDGRQYSKPMLSTGFSKGKDADGLAMNDAGAMAEQLKIEIRTHQTITAINPAEKVVMLGNEALAYSDLVLALGAEPFQLPIEGSEHLYHVNDLMDYAEFHSAVQGKKRVLVMGAGLVGCEYAHDLASAGFEVDLVAPDAQPLSRLVPAPVGQALQPALETLGVSLHLEKAVTSVSKVGEQYVAHLSDGSQLEADVMLSAVGLKPRVALAQAAAIEVNRAIVVNQQLQTSAPHVYAIGDCAEVEGLNLLYVLPLMNGARALAKTLAGQPTDVKYPVMPVMVKTPSLPIVTCPPAQDSEGEWEFDGQSPHIKALFKDSGGNLLGYALTGDCVAEKMALNKELPVMLA
ncbi:FAD-dependent oxidoreductase [Bermanella sp. WJH001]|uniref:FAD-dependent oxidoreductase n=1 Tax=Bermanella sp. WJH001 TaxID=3048005 RepID=UPI0024BE9048|nr:FAD-dependent oxidoreductase [Bermanella sp. WJH001]MDJ1538818.1 FAD-dependent oxidoreductase [Bermanella sp. WJH001]